MDTELCLPISANYRYTWNPLTIHDLIIDLDFEIGTNVCVMSGWGLGMRYSIIKARECYS